MLSLVAILVSCSHKARLVTHNADTEYIKILLLMQYVMCIRCDLMREMTIKLVMHVFYYIIYIRQLIYDN